MKKKKVFFVIISLRDGGAERVMTNIVKNISQDIYDICLILFKKEGALLSEIPEHVRVCGFGKNKKIDFFKLILRMSVQINREKPDVVVSFLNYTNIICLFAGKFSFHKFKFIASVRTHSSISHKASWAANIQLKMLLALLGSADVILVPSKGVGADLTACRRDIQGKVKLIYNPLDIDSIDGQKEEKIFFPQKYILAVGRLTKAKAFDSLIHAYARIVGGIEEHLLILGDGEERPNLLALAKELGVEDRVKLLGHERNPYKFMKNASVFVLSSRFEGFPNVVLEAMASGAPVVSTNCPSGPSEIIENSRNGILVPAENIVELSEAILRLVKDPSLREQFIREGRKTVERFKMKKIVNQWQEILT